MNAERPGPAAPDRGTPVTGPSPDRPRPGEAARREGASGQRQNPSARSEERGDRGPRPSRPSTPRSRTPGTPAPGAPASDVGAPGARTPRTAPPKTGVSGRAASAAAASGAGPSEDRVPPAAAAPAPATAPTRAAAPAPQRTGRQRLAAALWPPRLSRAQFIVALLLFALGLGLAIQVRTTSDQSRLRGARQEDLVRILDELDSRNQRLGEDKRDLESQRTELENSSNQAAAARKQSQKKANELGVLAGSVAAQGPGITLTINDAGGHVRADMLLDTLQELRAAGAEAIQINDVRVVADTFFSDDLKSGGVEIDGRRVSQPYRFKVIGNPQDLEPALNIPGGVVQSMEKEQASVEVARSEKIVVSALRQAKKPDYARSAPE
ncbi:DUF881 domain-containing protein [Wenjunlia tyrosinilytica]|uniref:DUF881 domain-containing protein n=1 Tax=Wenjunlia tyrosinilytica TaxID=1544741 RepID=UPI001E631280|nr:DUF881 domain-containing protein [Wenjunlia tyrosinilytica]